MGGGGGCFCSITRYAHVIAYILTPLIIYKKKAIWMDGWSIKKGSKRQECTHVGYNHLHMKQYLKNLYNAFFKMVIQFVCGWQGYARFLSFLTSQSTGKNCGTPNARKQMSRGLGGRQISVIPPLLASITQGGGVHRKFFSTPLNHTCVL